MADVSVTAANVQPGTSGLNNGKVAGVAITAGQWVYLDSATGTLKLADSNASLATATVIGVALNNAAIGQPVQYQSSGDYTVGGTVAAGAVYVLSANAGNMAPVADLASGCYTTVVAIGKTSSVATITLAQPSTLVAVP